MQNDLDSKGLLSCPFCGGGAKEHWPNSSTRHFIECGKCGARTATHLASHGGSARDDWNRRHLSAVPDGEGELVERLRAAIKLGDQMGVRGAHPSNIYNLASEAANALAASRLSQAGVRVTDEMVLAGCRVLHPSLFQKGLEPLASDGPATRSTIARDIASVRAILTAALSGDTL